MKPKYRVRETSPGTFVAEIRRLFFFWQSCYHRLFVAGSVDVVEYSSVKAAEEAIERHYKDYLYEREEKKRKRYVKEYTPVANSPLDKALE